MKTCTQCKATKALDNFSPQKKGRFGVTSICKPCTSERGKQWNKANPARASANHRRYAEANKEKASAYAKQWKLANATKERARQVAWLAANREKKAASVAKRRAGVLQAIPSWARMEDIAPFYRLAAWLTNHTGIQAHVDHLVPLQSKAVCGFHCAANLTVTTATLNKRKGCKWWPDMADPPAMESVWWKSR